MQKFREKMFLISTYSFVFKIGSKYCSLPIVNNQIKNMIPFLSKIHLLICLTCDQLVIDK